MPVAAAANGENRMRKIAILMYVTLLGAAPPPSPDARLRAIVAPVSQAQLRHTIETLVSFGTRHTLSSQTDPQRGIGAALNWAEASSAVLGSLRQLPDGRATVRNLQR